MRESQTEQNGRKDALGIFSGLCIHKTLFRDGLEIREERNVKAKGNMEEEACMRTSTTRILSSTHFQREGKEEEKRKKRRRRESGRGVKNDNHESTKRTRLHWEGEIPLASISTVKPSSPLLRVEKKASRWSLRVKVPLLSKPTVPVKESV